MFIKTLTSINSENDFEIILDQFYEADYLEILIFKIQSKLAYILDYIKTFINGYEEYYKEKNSNINISDKKYVFIILPCLPSLK